MINNIISNEIYKLTNENQTINNTHSNNVQKNVSHVFLSSVQQPAIDTRFRMSEQAAMQAAGPVSPSTCQDMLIFKTSSFEVKFECSMTL